MTERFMSWIKIIGITQARGYLKKVYKETLERAGRVWNITAIMSQNARTMKTSMDFYAAIMFGQSPLSRSQREILAVVVSATNQCVY